MKRWLIFLGLLVFSVHAKAQILNMSDSEEKLNVPEEFLKKLPKCKRYKDEFLSAPEGIVTKMVYHIKGVKNKRCEVQIDGYTNTNVHITQHCLFTPKQARIYSNSILNLQYKQYSPRREISRILADEDYLRAENIMTDENICTFHRDGIDETKEFRKNLLNCAEYTEIQSINSIDIKRSISQKEGDICHIDVTFTQKMPNLELRAHRISKRMWTFIDKFKEANYHFACLFDENKVKEYFDVLEAMIVPPEDGFDFAAAQRFSQESELEFIRKNCEYKVK